MVIYLADLHAIGDRINGKYKYIKRGAASRAPENTQLIRKCAFCSRIASFQSHSTTAMSLLMEKYLNNITARTSYRFDRPSRKLVRVRAQM